MIVENPRIRHLFNTVFDHRKGIKKRSGIIDNSCPSQWDMIRANDPKRINAFGRKQKTSTTRKIVFHVLRNSRSTCVLALSNWTLFLGDDRTQSDTTRALFQYDPTYKKAPTLCQRFPDHDVYLFYVNCWFKGKCTFIGLKRFKYA